MTDRWPDKTIIGLTGNIATGKSVVRRMLEHLGAFTIDADQLTHRAMAPDAPAYRPVVQMFGRWILDPDGRIDRQRLGRVVFSDPEALAILEGIIHPIVRQVIDLLIRRARQRVIVVEAIKLIESGLAESVDSLWVVDAPREVQIQRLIEKRGMAPADAEQRISAQPEQARKLARADVVIDNGGSVERTYNQVSRAFHLLIGQDEPVDEPAELASPGQLIIRRGTPRHAAQIATFLNRTVPGSRLDRDAMMLRFGEKAYMMALGEASIVALAGWQVENLIARVDEFVVDGQVKPDEVVPALIEHVENAAKDLQSEIALLFLRADSPPAVRQAVLAAGYKVTAPEELRIPDWREAARQSAPPGSVMTVKRLREDRVLKPI